MATDFFKSGYDKVQAYGKEVEIMDERIRELLRQIPSMEILLSEQWVVPHEREIGRPAVKGIFSDIIGEIRKSILEGGTPSIDVNLIRQEARKRLSRRSGRSLRPVVNATGVVIHTNLGRSCLSSSAVRAVNECASSYSTLEFDLSTGERGHRNSHVEWLLCQVTGADAAVVVNNNAGAVMLSLAALGSGKESIVSRGELVEIGGSFRIPDIMATSGTHLVEVGTTNRTHLHDYAGAITENTGLILKVHPSNFRVVGFQSEVSREELAALAREKEIIFMEDLGSGFLLDTESFGLRGETSVRGSVLAGVDIVTFSGDKMLGGPQAGVIAGRLQIIEKLRKHPLMRALRPDKMTLAALEATLRDVLAGKTAEIPTLAMISTKPEELLRKARRLSQKLKKRHTEYSFSIVTVQDAVGGGSYPEIPLQGYAVSISHPFFSSGQLQNKLREAECPVIAAAREGMVLFHVRTLREGDDSRIDTALSHISRNTEVPNDGES
jgi:L-seryl-tRNA(Ser) seleniumtransferase